jgi:sulfur carrier protein ThiS
MPAISQYTVDITIRVREGHHEGPAEALAAAIEKLGIADQAVIVASNIIKRPDGVTAAAKVREAS